MRTYKQQELPIKKNKVAAGIESAALSVSINDNLTPFANGVINSTNIIGTAP